MEYIFGRKCSILSLLKQLTIVLTFFLSFQAEIEMKMRELFEVPENKDVRLWNKYMSNTYEHLSKPENTIQDAGLYQGQVNCLNYCLSLESSPHDALKHQFKSLKTDLIFLKLGVLERKFLWNWLTNT